MPLTRHKSSSDLSAAVPGPYVHPNARSGAKAVPASAAKLEYAVARQTRARYDRMVGAEDWLRIGSGSASAETTGRTGLDQLALRSWQDVPVTTGLRELGQCGRQASPSLRDEDSQDGNAGCVSRVEAPAGPEMESLDGTVSATGATAGHGLAAFFGRPAEEADDWISLDHSEVDSDTHTFVTAEEDAWHEPPAPERWSICKIQLAAPGIGSSGRIEQGGKTWPWQAGLITLEPGLQLGGQEISHIAHAYRLLPSVPSSSTPSYTLLISLVLSLAPTPVPRHFEEPTGRRDVQPPALSSSQLAALAEQLVPQLWRRVAFLPDALAATRAGEGGSSDDTEDVGRVKQSSESLATVEEMVAVHTRAALEIARGPGKVWSERVGEWAYEFEFGREVDASEIAGGGSEGFQVSYEIHTALSRMAGFSSPTVIVADFALPAHASSSLDQRAKPITTIASVSDALEGPAHSISSALLSGQSGLATSASAGDNTTSSAALPLPPGFPCSLPMAHSQSCALDPSTLSAVPSLTLTDSIGSGSGSAAGSVAVDRTPREEEVGFEFGVVGEGSDEGGVLELNFEEVRARGEVKSGDCEWVWAGGDRPMEEEGGAEGGAAATDVKVRVPRGRRQGKRRWQKLE